MQQIQASGQTGSWAAAYGGASHWADRIQDDAHGTVFFTYKGFYYPESGVVKNTCLFLSV
ncbi:MAG: hypothetical protein ABN482_15095 [Corticimicrobacter sp.]|uniref:hypothetical protein n=1 Tax=Corticimicrobacter sp. TaxID=2678536 RepID=UPI0032DABA77